MSDSSQVSLKKWGRKSGSKLSAINSFIFDFLYYFFDSILMSVASREGLLRSVKEESGTNEGEEYFLILRNCRKSMDIISSSDKDIIPDDDDAPPSSEKREEESPQLSTRRRRRMIKKEKKSKNYSSVSQNKRQIAVRYKDRSEDGSHQDPKLIQLWKQLWQVELHELRKTQDVESLRYFGEEDFAPLQTMEPEQKREMTPLPSPEKKRERLEMEEQQANDIEHDFMFNPYFHYESSFFEQVQDSQSFFFEKAQRGME